ncbi:hypothetical protein [Leptospira andrefontaineae]|uniref:Uncharacterized protein n=1 Tax=Leptospira andrefontaineae TaxID=2484976 RepID=A0A4R9HB80_9LEPT|nr:hypothetical protein [Leptospira andrefontaineae]TGK43813.1 hypothetical protein EHO65_04035 [Leptospira andrefontaineae]
MRISKLFQILIISSLIVTNIVSCDGNKDGNDKSIIALLAANSFASLPEPDVDTVTMIVGGNNFVLTDKLDCKEGATGIGFLTNDADQMPTLFIHNVDFSVNFGVNVTGGAGPFHVDIDTASGTYFPTTTCPASIMENSLTTYDLQVINCGVSPFGGGATNTVSFRVRCTKD